MKPRAFSEAFTIANGRYVKDNFSGAMFVIIAIVIAAGAAIGFAAYMKKVRKNKQFQYITVSIMQIG